MREESGRADLGVPPELVDRARALVARGGRRILGITGAPGAGKSTLAHQLVEALGEDARLVGMDGFHLAEAELHRLGRHDRKGAPDTFDAAGFVALLHRLRASEETVWAPEYRRDLRHGVTGAIEVPATTPLVIVEGNYLLCDEAGFAPVRELLDETWFCEIDDDVRIERLIARHIATGKEPGFAREWVLGSDEANARLVATTRDRADRLVATD